MNTSWFSFSRKISEYSKEQKSHSKLRLDGAYLYILENTQITPKGIKWNGTIRQLNPGQCLLTFSTLADYLECHPKTAKRIIETLMPLLGFTYETSTHRSSGGVILTWDNWEDIHKPWKKFYSEDRAHQSADSSASNSFDTQSFQPDAKQTTRIKVAPLKEYKIINNINTPPLNPPQGFEPQGEGKPKQTGKPKRKSVEAKCSKGVREIAEIFKTNFPNITTGTKAIERFSANLESEGWTEKQAVKTIEEFANDIFLKQTLFSINGIFHIDQRKQDLQLIRERLNGLTSESFKTIEERDLWLSELFKVTLQFAQNRKWRHFGWVFEDFKNYFADEISNLKVDEIQTEQAIQPIKNDSNKDIDGVGELVETQQSQTLQQNIASEIETHDPLTDAPEQPETVVNQQPQVKTEEKFDDNQVLESLEPQAIEAENHRSTRAKGSPDSTIPNDPGTKNTLSPSEINEALTDCKTELDIAMTLEELAYEQSRLPRGVNDGDGLARFFCETIRKFKVDKNQQYQARYYKKLKLYEQLAQNNNALKIPKTPYNPPFPNVLTPMQEAS